MSYIFDVKNKTTIQQDFEFFFESLNKHKSRSKISYAPQAMFALINNCMKTWPFRRGSYDIEQFLAKVGVRFESRATVNIMSQLELYINLLHWLPGHDKQFGKYDCDVLEKNCQMFLDNIDDILNKQGMSVRTKLVDGCKQYLITRLDPNTVVAAACIPELSEQLYSYCDVRNTDDIKLKKSVLLALADKLEPARKELSNGILGPICDNVFKAFNKCGIRHNNKDQYDLSDNEKLRIFDETYKMCLILLQEKVIVDYNTTMKMLDNKNC